MDYAMSIGFDLCALDFSPIKGPEGNIEYTGLVYIHLDADTAANLSGLSVQRCLGALLVLEIKKAVSKRAGGIWTKRM